MPTFKELRNAAGITQKSLSDQSGVGLRTIKNCEAGKRMSIDTAVRLAPLLNVPILTLMLEVPNESS